MKRSILLLFIVAAISLSLSRAQDKQGTPPGMPGMEEMMKRWMEYKTPDDHHKKLDIFVGSWDVSTDMYMTPDAPPQTSKGTCEFKWVLGGRYIQQEYTGSMMGMPYHGIGFNGYDKGQKNYFMIWLDDMGTAYSTGTGYFDQAGKVLTMYGKMDDPSTGEFGKNERYVLTLIDENKFSFTIYDLAGGENYKVIDMTYTRKK